LSDAAEQDAKDIANALAREAVTALRNVFFVIVIHTPLSKKLN
jgi:hypothetical protein